MTCDDQFDDELCSYDYNGFVEAVLDESVYRYISMDEVTLRHSHSEIIRHVESSCRAFGFSQHIGTKQMSLSLF